MVDEALSKFGGLHVVFNNAGTFAAAPLAEMTEEMTDSILNINLKALVFCFKYQVHLLFSQESFT